MRFGRAFTLVVLGSLVWSTAGHAAKPIASPRLHFLGLGPPISSDGTRYSYEWPAGGPLRVRDAYSGRQFTVPPPADCPGGAGFGGGEVLFDCSPYTFTEPPRGVVVDLGKLTYTPIPSLPRWPFAGYELRYSAIGSHWVEFNGTNVRDTTSGYEDWRSGSVRDPSVDPRQVDDMNSPGLVRRMCAPISRSYSPLFPDAPGALFNDFTYDQPYGLSVVDRTSSYYLTLQRCGSSRRRFVCRECSAQLAGGLLSWSIDAEAAGRARYDVGAELLASGKRFRWRVRRRQDSGAITVSAQVRGRLYISVFTSRPRGARLYTVAVR